MKVIIDRDVSMTGRDGVLLRADIFRPDDGVHPVLLTRTPYGKQFQQFSDAFGQPLINLTERGYAVVIQDCRGTGASGGDFEFYVNEGTDGSDTVEWCATQPWSNGKVGMFGGSYVSTTQFTTAFEAPEALKVIAGAVSPAQYYGELAYRGGAFCLAVGYQWTWARALDQIVRSGQTPPPGFPTDTSRSGDALTTLPVRDLLTLLPASTPGHLKDWLDHPTLDDYWRQISYVGKYPSAQTPGLHVAGWFDVFLSGTLQNYAAMRDRSATPESRSSQHLIVGPWTHTNWSDLNPASDPPPSPSPGANDAPRPDRHAPHPRTADA